MPPMNPNLWHRSNSGHRNLYVIHVDHGDPGETLWRGLAELAQPIVVSLENGSQKLAVRHLEQLEARVG